MDNIGMITTAKPLKLEISRQSAREKFILSLLTMQLLLPVLFLLIFIYLGVFLNPYSIYFLISVAILGYTFICIARQSNIAVYIHFTLFLLVQITTIMGHILEFGPGDGIMEGLRTVSNFYYCWYLGFACYYTFYTTNRMHVLLKWIVNAGLFIAIVNIIHFYFNTILDNYTGVRSYLEILNQSLADYLDLEGTNGWLRHAGYFLDTHSQFFIPLAAMYILYIEKIKVSPRWFYYSVFVLSILLSGVKTAYLIMLVLWLIILMKSNIKAVLNMLLILILMTLAILIFFNETVVNMVIMIFTHDLDILIEHIFTNPSKLFNEYPNVFLIGGNPGLVEKIYSEVYLVTLMYYTGIVGLLFFLTPLPIFLMNKNRKYYLGLIMFIYLIFTLSHYPIFKVGINNVVSALPFVYFLAAINDFTIKNGK